MRRFILMALALGALALVAGGLILRRGAHDPVTAPTGPQQAIGPGKTIGKSALSHGGSGLAERNRDTGADQPGGRKP